MTVQERNSGNDTSEDAGKTAEEIRGSLTTYNQRILEKRKAKGNTIIGKVEAPVSGFSMMASSRSLKQSDTQAAEFTIVSALETIDLARPSPIPVFYFEDNGNDNDYLQLEIPRWADTANSDYDGTQDEVIVLFNGIEWTYEESEGDLPYRIPYPTPPETTFPITVYVTPQMLARQPEGPVLISYLVRNTVLENPDSSTAQVITLDRYAPSRNTQPAALGVPPGVPAPGPEGSVVLTKEYLEANATVLFPVSTYTVARRGDAVSIFLLGQETPIFTGEIWPRAEAARRADIEVPSTVLQALGNGSRQLLYTLADYEGNVSGRSHPLNVTIQLALQPGNLEAPVVDSPIDRAQAVAGVTVEIPDYPNAQASDVIQLSWHTPTSTRPLASFPFSQRTTTVDWAFLSDPDPRAVYEGSVTYVVIRGGDTFGPSLAADVSVDLSLIGPVNPNDPDPVNPDLAKLVVRGRDSDKDNLIDHHDANEAATIHLTVYAGARVGELVRFTYGTQELAPAHLLTQDEIDIGHIQVPLPWAIIQTMGNGSIPAFYRISAADDSANYQQSRTTFVSVMAITAPTDRFVAYSHASITRQNRRPGTAITETSVINCRVEPWDGVQVMVRFEQGDLQLGDIVTFYWVFSAGQLGQAEVKDSRFPAPVTATAAHLENNKIEARIPYEATRFGESVVPYPPQNPPQDGLPRAVLGSVVCYFTLRRGTTILLSEKSLVKYGTLQGGRVCTGWRVV
nr:hypothetical protein [uncultured Pseudomonas sp.]